MLALHTSNPGLVPGFPYSSQLGVILECKARRITGYNPRQKQRKESIKLRVGLF